MGRARVGRVALVALVNWVWVFVGNALWYFNGRYDGRRKAERERAERWLGER